MSMQECARYTDLFNNVWDGVASSSESCRVEEDAVMEFFNDARVVISQLITGYKQVEQLYWNRVLEPLTSWSYGFVQREENNFQPVQFIAVAPSLLSKVVAYTTRSLAHGSITRMEHKAIQLTESGQKNLNLLSRVTRAPRFGKLATKHTLVY